MFHTRRLIALVAMSSGVYADRWRCACTSRRRFLNGRPGHADILGATRYAYRSYCSADPAQR